MSEGEDKEKEVDLQDQENEESNYHFLCINDKKEFLNSLRRI